MTLSTEAAGKSTRGSRDHETGFTLAEVMIVVLIIGILLSVAVPTFVGARNRAHDTAALAHLNTAATAAIVVGIEEGDLSSATAPLLSVAEPSLTFVDASIDSTGPSVVSVGASTLAEWTAVVRSNSGRCFGMRMTLRGRSMFEPSSCSAASASELSTPPASTATTTTNPPATTTTNQPALPPCSSIAVDSFQQSGYTWAFQLRNTTAQTLIFQFVVPSTNYQLTNLVFSGSGQNMTLQQTTNGDGTSEITVSGSVPAYQSAGGQQPNGFNGQLNPTSGVPFTRCQ